MEIDELLQHNCVSGRGPNSDAESQLEHAPRGDVPRRERSSEAKFPVEYAPGAAISGSDVTGDGPIRPSTMLSRAVAWPVGCQCEQCQVKQARGGVFSGSDDMGSARIVVRSSDAKSQIEQVLDGASSGAHVAGDGWKSITPSDAKVPVEHVVCGVVSSSRDVGGGPSGFCLTMHGFATSEDGDVDTLGTISSSAHTGDGSNVSVLDGEDHGGVREGDIPSQKAQKHARRREHKKAAKEQSMHESKERQSLPAIPRRQGKKDKAILKNNKTRKELTRLSQVSCVPIAQLLAKPHLLEMATEYMQSSEFDNSS